MPRSFSDDERKRLAQEGKAMSDGGYPIRNREDLVNAVRAYGRGDNKPEVKKWIKKRAKELDAEQYLPENWQVDDKGSLAHYGVKGMKWGEVHHKRNEHNKSYTDKQRKNDRAMYGNRAEKRINRKLNEGYGLQGARHFEVERKERSEKRKKTVRKAGTTVASLVLGDYLFNGGANTKLAVDLSKRAVKAGADFVKNVASARYN